VIRAVTLDAYGTVFDFESHLSDVAGEALAAARVDGLEPRRLAEAWSAHFQTLYDEFGSCHHADGREFRTIAELTTDSLAAAYRQHGLERLDPRPGVDIWLGRLRAVRPFPEVEAVIGQLGARLPLAMLSDTDDDIIAPALERLRVAGKTQRPAADCLQTINQQPATSNPLPFCFVLTSEQVRAYKQDPRAVLFRRALEELELPAAEVLHVGDSPGDIGGAKTAGMRVAWVNRNGGRLPAGCPRPDAEIRDLSTLPELVESMS